VSEIRLDQVGKVYAGDVRAVDDVSLTIASGEFMVLVGPSGGGKSTLLIDTLYKAIARKLNNASEGPAPHDRIEGLEHIDKIIDIDQSPIGRTPRSNPATYTGAFTPTEAAAVSAVYAFVVAVFVYGDMGLRDVPKVLLSSANMSAMILYIITNAVLFSFLMTSEQIPQAMTAWIKDSGIGWVEFLLVVNLLLLLAGNVMEPSSIVLITAPILFPIAVSLGINPVHLGILMTVNMEVGLCHPPVGLNLYVASGIARMGITELTIATWPWLVTMLIFLAMVTYIPELSLWLPRVLGML